VNKAIRTTWLFWLSVALLVALPLAAAAAPAAEPEAPSAQAEGGEVEPQWVPLGSYPGFYAARDNRNLDPTEYALVGSHQSFYWDQLEPAEGAYNWGPIQTFLNRCQASGKKASLQIITFNGRANQFNPLDPAIRVPAWVFAAGAGKVTASDGFQIPKYWDPVYKAKYRNFVAALAAQFDGHATLEYIQMGVGKFGETQPCDERDDAAVTAALVADGLTQWTWPYIVNDIVDMYADAFDTTKVVLPSAPTFAGEGERKAWMDHAISRGVGLFNAGAYADLEWVDLRTQSTLSGAGKYDPILDQAGLDTPWAPVSFEMYRYMTPNATTFYWALAGILSRRADYVTLERDVLYEGYPADPVVTPLYENIAALRWAGQYMGKRMSDTPSVWVLLRESGNKYSIYPQRGNYSFGLQQDDSAAQGRTVVTTYRSRAQLPREGLNETYANLDIEVGQAFLNAGRSGYDAGMPPYEGWICRRTDQGSGNPNMVFKVDDRYLYGGINQVTLSVIYLDRGSDSWQLVYDAAGNAARVAGVVTKTNSGLWRKAVFNLSDARFANSQSGADFRIESMGDGNEYIQMVDVAKGAGLPGDSIALRAGWNLISFNVEPMSGGAPISGVAQVLSSIDGLYSAVQGYDQGAQSYYPELPAEFNDLQELDPYHGYWIKMDQAATLQIVGVPIGATTPLTLHEGWNLVSYLPDEEMAAAEALASIAGKYTAVQGFHDGGAVSYYTDLPPEFNDLQCLRPGHGYWIKASQAVTLTYPVTGTCAGE